jgi:hypothetical protein
MSLIFFWEKNKNVNENVNKINFVFMNKKVKYLKMNKKTLRRIDKK